MIGGIELGGTKTVCGISLDGQTITASTRFPTGTVPAAALQRACAFFDAAQQEYGPLGGLGVASFGPCERDRRSPNYGRITTTPKPGWRNTDVLAGLGDGLGPHLRMVFDTDVNAAALAEMRHGAGRGLDSLVYLTVGTGIGGGVVAGGRLLHGLSHPEIGHIPIRRPAAELDRFPGTCPFHGDCLEGVASGPAIAARWGSPGEHLPADHPAWALEADYLADALATILYVVAPKRVILGGGVGRVPQVLALTRARLLDVLAGYIRHPLLDNGAADFVVGPALGDQAGVIGACCLADQEVCA